MMKPLSRDDADASRFFMGAPCRHGHNGKRYAAGGSCVECRQAINAKHKATSPVWQAYQAARNASQEGKAYHAAWRHQNGYGEPIAFRFLRYVAQHYCDDLSGLPVDLTDLHQDHDHATRRVRGLISGPYNRAVGMLDDSPLRATQAASYLVRHAADDPDHPLLADQDTLRAIKTEAEQLVAMVGRFIV